MVSEVKQSYSPSTQQLWLKWLVILLFCYALLERSFAYLFLGELLIIAGILLLLLSGRFMVIASVPILFLWALFAVWGACRTIPFLALYRFDALRDAVLWGYGSVMVMIVAFVRRSSQIARALEAYRKFLRWYLFVIPVLLYFSMALSASLPRIPWSQEAPILAIRGGEVAVHLCGIALFLLLIPNRRKRSQRGEISVFAVVRVACYAVALSLVAINARSGFLAIAMPVAVASIFRIKQVGFKVVALSVVMAVVGFGVLASGFISITSHTRKFTPDQLGQNLASIVGSKSSGGDIQDTKAWRLVWWSKIVNYTVFGPYRWTGKGFGINLAKTDMPPELVGGDDPSLRDPHNGSMTVLARMGIPGFALWVAINLTFVFSILRAYRKAAAARSDFWSSVDLWIFCYWLSAFINMSFEIYVEGPQGGIWFWSIIGFGVAAMRIQAHEARQHTLRARSNLSHASLFSRPEPAIS